MSVLVRACVRARESSLNPNSNTLEPDRPLVLSPSSILPPTFAFLRFHSRKEDL